MISSYQLLELKYQLFCKWSLFIGKWSLGFVEISIVTPKQKKIPKGI